MQGAAVATLDILNWEAGQVGGKRLPFGGGVFLSKFKFIVVTFTPVMG